MSFARRGCFKCGNVGHLQADCPSIRVAGGGGGGGGRCYSCGKYVSTTSLAIARQTASNATTAASSATSPATARPRKARSTSPLRRATGVASAVTFRATATTTSHSPFRLSPCRVSEAFTASFSYDDLHLE
ncbi:hypothetical protein BC938DRAFT_471280 [Jimgerdemannia flammicorona]|uniref:CCHC-type domain-containing protein n=1 Tax=Jimgerdemannia flammicorona TaxID=994334 RepID=A0A433Q8I2_9FUNG|nr:hypothetical protein BC938DRAFT_471280 [Jimgerdemannia flammicorona]